MAEEPEEVQPIDWNDPDIPVQFYALRREVIRLNIMVEALMKYRKNIQALDEIDKPGSELRASAWKDILERHRKAIEPEES